MAVPTTKLPQYDAIRSRLKSQFGERKQEQTDAIKRRFAAQGMVGAGAFGKAQDEAAARVAKEEADATSQLDFAEANELQRRQEVAEGRQFQTSERLGAQQFNQGMFDKDFGLKEKTFDEQRRQFQQEFDANMQSNKVSAVANFVGDDIENHDKVALAKQWVDNLFSGGSSPNAPAAPAKPKGAWRQGASGWNYFPNEGY